MTLRAAAMLLALAALAASPPKASAQDLSGAYSVEAVGAATIVRQADGSTLILLSPVLTRRSGSAATPTMDTSAPVVQQQLVQLNVSVGRDSYRYGDPAWKKACRARGVYPSSCLPSAPSARWRESGRHQHGRRSGRDARAVTGAGAGSAAKPAWPAGIPADFRVGGW